jgi:protein phosphatase
MGGANAGEYASKLAVQTIAKQLQPSLQGAFSNDPEQRSRVILNLFETIHRNLLSMGRFYEEVRGMGATLSLCWFHPGGMTFGHIGDSRIYALPETGSILQLTDDHSEVGRLYRAGVLNEREAKTHPRKNILEQSLGGGTQNIKPQTGEWLPHHASHVVLCSDGICDGLYNQSIGHIVRNPTPNIAHLRPSERLIREALFNSGKDNLTAVVLKVTESVTSPA